ncbi:MAG: dTMP kinase [Archaeoglobus sp.]|nr:dTMP kinase [Archaeoglobus sp.]
MEKFFNWILELKVVLIAIEGIDGSGKTTVAEFLRDELEKLGYSVALLKEPTDSEWGRKLKKSYSSRLRPEEELELFLKDREYDVRENILPALKSGKIVIMDRYYLSTIAYQGALGFDPAKLKEKNEEIAPKPDLTFILDIPPEKAVSRVKKRGDRPNDFEKLEYLKKVREIFLWCAKTIENAIVIDASKELNEIKKEILTRTLEKLRAE